MSVADQPMFLSDEVFELLVRKIPAAILEEVYFAALARAPFDDEKQVALAHVAKAADRRKGWEDVLWAVVNTREFLFRH